MSRRQQNELLLAPYLDMSVCGFVKGHMLATSDTTTTWHGMDVGYGATLTRAERIAAGKAARTHAPRSSHGEWQPDSSRPDPIALLQEQAATRVPELVPLRYGRMLASPFAFYRGSAIIMAQDLARTPTSEITAQICGDAHLSNFGAFATPERRLVFDLNDFDETLPGPWEWDVKRLAGSIVVAGRSHNYTDALCREIVEAAIRAYRERMWEFSEMSILETWYARLDLNEIMNEMKPLERAVARRAMAQARKRTNLQAFTNMTEIVNGARRFKENPPTLVHAPEGYDLHIPAPFTLYRESLPYERRILLDHYRYVDIALKVVGVGSVGTFCLVCLLDGGEDQDPLLLQIKEASASVLERHLTTSPYSNHGQRVVVGQRLMQAASDIFLGWLHSDASGRDYYVRQLRDMKYTVDLTRVNPSLMTLYVGWCAWALARAHARTSDPAMIAGYLGKSDAFDQALVRFAFAYADQTERDHAALARAVKEGRLQAEKDQDGSIGRR